MKNTKPQYRQFYLYYTLAFCVVAVLVFSSFMIYRKTLINSADAWNQHYRALLYYGRYLRAIIRSVLFEHRLVIPSWDFSLSEGSDILLTLQYYVMGDPFALSSVFVPARYTHILYGVLIIVRMYTAGITFSMLAFGTGKRNRHAVLAGAICYAFCYWSIYCGTMHPFFMNALIYLPLIILGIEKVLRGDRPYLYIWSLAVAGASNAYFFYMICIVVAVYSVCRVFTRYRGRSAQGLKTLFCLLGYSVAGVLIAAITLGPMLLNIAGDSRTAIARAHHLFYPISYYKLLPAALVSGRGSYYLCLGFTAPVILSCILLFAKRRMGGLLKALWILCFVSVLFPVAGQFFNGMSYMSNRWCWIFALLASYVLVFTWDHLLHIRDKEWYALVGAFVAIAALVLLFKESRNGAAISMMILLLIALLILRLISSGIIGMRTGQKLIIIVAAVGIAGMSFWRYFPAGENYVRKYEAREGLYARLMNSEAQAVAIVDGGPFPRYSGADIQKNDDFLHGVSSTAFYWSLSNPHINQYRWDMELREQSFYNYTNYDDRAALNTLSGVSYYIADGEKKKPPFGFSETGVVDAGGGRAVYRNEYALPIGYCYDTFITRDRWEQLDAVQKQQVQLRAAYVEEPVSGISELQSVPTDYRIPADVRPDQIMREENGAYHWKTKNAEMEVTFEAEGRAETYVELSGVSFKSDYARSRRNETTETEIVLRDNAGTEKKLSYLTVDNPYTSGRKRFLVNLGYSEEPRSSVRIRFAEWGEYTVQGVNVYSVPVSEYVSGVKHLRDATLKEVAYGTDRVGGALEIASDKILCMAIPYSEGWSATVDGIETPVMCLNERHLGIKVEAGKHDIEFRYHSPQKRMWGMLSAIGIMGFFLLVVVREHKSKRRSAA